jgi:hypothetical protein
MELMEYIRSMVCRIYCRVYNLYYNIQDWIYNWWYQSDASYHRCTHCNDLSEEYKKVLETYNQLISPNERVILGTSDNPLTIESDTKIVIPMVFHLIDPQLGNRSVEYWSKHINSKIIPRLNEDYNRNKENYGKQYVKTVDKLFEDAASSKHNHYLNLVNIFPHNLNVEWIFYLAEIKMNPNPNLTINTSSETIYRSITLIDPESKLNIIILPGNKILGISTFPFTDRDPDNESKINPKYLYRQGVLINSFIFKGNLKPFNMYRTFTHEIGHWCGLLHPFDNKTYLTSDIKKLGLNVLKFGGQEEDFTGDLIADTTPQKNPTYGTVYDYVRKTYRYIEGKFQLVKIRSTPYASIFEHNDDTPNFFNFMDYTDDTQMCMFTQLQMLHMIYMIARFRPNFISQ